MDEKLEDFKNQYHNVPIPKELDLIVEKALRQAKRKKKNRAPQWLLGVVAATMLFTASVNIHPAMARTLSDIPVIGSIVKILTWTKYEVTEDTYEANIEVPTISYSGNTDFANTLNEKYRLEGKALYNQFMAEMSALKANGGSHYSINSSYNIKTENDQTVSIEHAIITSAGSSSTVHHYDTIDKQNDIIITLPMLFKDDSYIRIISENIKKQMREQIAATNNEKTYWIKGADIPDQDLINNFTAINNQQQFYISNKGKLIISFDKYEVAPGYMGAVTFEIPTDVLQNSLVSNKYIH